MTRRLPFADMARRVSPGVFRGVILALALGVAPLSATSALADPPQAGGQVPLSRVLKMLAEQYKGKQLNTTMGESGGRAVYLVQWQLPDGRIKVFTVDAQTGQVVGS